MNMVFPKGKDWSTFLLDLFSPVAAVMCLLAFGCSESSIPKESPNDHVRFDYYGATYLESTVTLKEPYQTLWAQEIVENYHSPRKSDEPDVFKPVDLDPSCRLPNPSRRAEVTSIQIDGGRQALPLYFVPIKEKKETPEIMVRVGRHLRKSPVKKVNVYVTETRHPVYLILSASSSILWVLHLAEEVKLDGVAVIGYKAQALAQLPKSTRVGFVIGNSIQSKCYEQVARPVDETWLALDKAKDRRRGDMFRKTINQSKKEHRRFRAWLRTHVDSPDTVITANSTSHVLVGPKPKKRIQQRALAGTTILHTPKIMPVWG